MTPPQACLFAALTPAAGEALLLVWVFALGAAVGSFLNVVIYRLPVGLSLVLPGSHCPTCKHPIRWYDNTPVFGWIMLRGRCRDCGTWISPRYPIVEAVTAGLFVLVVLTEGISLGANLPVRPGEVTDGVVCLPPGIGLVAGLVAFHLLLLCTMLCAALIQYDGNRMPLSLVVPALVVGLAAPLVFPELRPVPAGPPLVGWIAGVVDGAAGLMAGLVFGLISRPATGATWNLGFAFLLGAVGLFLGWQATICLGLVAVAIHTVIRAASGFWPWPRRVPPTTWLALGALAWILSWKVVVEAWPVLG
jgi:leader peptidase (prepilin peptidase)/N-methyltransferase